MHSRLEFQALNCRMQELFLMQIQNLKSDFRGFDFLLFLEIKFESNLSKTTFSRTKSQIEYHSFSLSSTGFHRIKQTSKNDNDRSDFIFIFFFDDSFLGR